MSAAEAPRVQANRVIGDEGLVATGDRVALELRLPWYRSLPLSTVEVATVEIDGAVIDPAAMTLELEGRSYTLNELEEQTGHVWYVLDSAWLMLPALPPGESHKVRITMFLYPPYIKGLKRPVRETRTLQVRHKEKADG